MIGLRFTEVSNIIIETIVCQRQLGVDVGGPWSVVRCVYIMGDRA